MRKLKLRLVEGRPPIARGKGSGEPGSIVAIPSFD